MAGIKMDVTEYELLKNKSVLLENALEREKELSGKLELLQKEKIEALKQNEKRIVKVIRKETIETIFQKISEQEIIERMRMFFSSSPRDRFELSLSISSIDGQSELHRLIDCFFDKSKIIKTPEESVEVVGFTGEYSKIKEEYLSKLSKENNKKLDSYEKLKEEHSKLETSLIDQKYLQEKIDILIKELDSEKELCKDEKVKFNTLKTEVIDYLNNNKVSVFNSSEFKSQLIKNIKEFKLIKK